MSTDQPDLPALHEAVLDEDFILRLTNDLENSASQVRVAVRAARFREIDETPRELRPAISALLEGSVSGVQVTYRFAGQEWTDTIMPVKGGWRIVRMAYDGP